MCESPPPPGARNLGQPNPDAGTALQTAERSHVEHVRKAARLRKWFKDHLWKIGFGALAAFAGAIFDRFSDEINAWARSLLVAGIGGTYVIESFTYPENKTELVPDSGIIELKDGGGTVFGVTKYYQPDPGEYKMFGYHRIKFLLISYGGKGPLGGGTLALQNDIATAKGPVFWGWRTSVECRGPESYLYECPAVVYPQGSRTEYYNDFLQKEYCRPVTWRNVAELCEQLKKRQ